METVVETLKWLSLALVVFLIITLVIIAIVLIKRAPLGRLAAILSGVVQMTRTLWPKLLAFVAKLAIWKYVSSWWRKRRPARSEPRSGGTSLLQSKAAYLFVCLVVATLLVRGTRTLTNNIPWAVLFPYIVGVTALLALAAIVGWLVKHPEHRADASKWPWGRIIGWSAALLILFLVAPAIYRYATTPDNERIVTRDWSDPPIEVPPGTDIVWNRMTNAAYQLQTDDGRLYYFERDPLEDDRTECEKHERVPPPVKSFRLRIVDKEIESSKFVWRYYLFGQSPCAAATRESGADEPPPLPDGIPTEPEPRKNPYGKFGRPNEIRTSSN